MDFSSIEGLYECVFVNMLLDLINQLHDKSLIRIKFSQFYIQLIQLSYIYTSIITHQLLHVTNSSRDSYTNSDHS